MHLGKTERHKLTPPPEIHYLPLQGGNFSEFFKHYSLKSESRKVRTLAHFAQQLFLETNYEWFLDR